MAADARRIVPQIAHAALWLLVASSLYEGYLVLPGLAGHSLFSVLAKILVVPLAVAVVVFGIRYRPPGRVAIAFFSLFVVWVLVSFVVHRVRTYPVEYYVWSQASGWAVLAATWLLARHRAWLAGLWQFGLPLYWVATLVVALWEIHTGHHLGASSVRGRPVPTAFYFDPNNLGAALALTLPFVWFWPLAWDNREWAKVGAALLTVLLLYVLVKTGSRGGELALILDLAALPLVLRGRARAWAAGGLVAALAVLVGLVAWARHLGPVHHLPLALSKLARLPDLFTTRIPAHLPPNVAPGSVAIRWALYRSGFWALELHPFGLGPRGAEAWYAYWVTHHSPYNTYGITDPHNLWLEVAMNFGWVGLLLFVGGFVAVLRQAWRGVKAADPLARGLGGAAFCGLIGFILGALSPSSVMIGFNIMWVSFGLAVAAGRLPNPSVEAAAAREGAVVAH
jgi:hypothetical protein